MPVRYGHQTEVPLDACSQWPGTIPPMPYGQSESSLMVGTYILRASRRDCHYAFSLYCNILIDRVLHFAKMLGGGKKACFGRDSSHLTYWRMDKVLIIRCI